jgi:hypothetical protein
MLMKLNRGVWAVVSRDGTGPFSRLWCGDHGMTSLLKNIIFLDKENILKSRRYKLHPASALI